MSPSSDWGRNDQNLIVVWKRYRFNIYFSLFFFFLFFFPLSPSFFSDIDDINTDILHLDIWWVVSFIELPVRQSCSMVWILMVMSVNDAMNEIFFFPFLSFFFHFFFHSIFTSIWNFFGDWSEIGVWAEFFSSFFFFWLFLVYTPTFLSRDNISDSMKCRVNVRIGRNLPENYLLEEFFSYLTFQFE